MSELKERIEAQNLTHLSLERASGETYSGNNPVLYGHGTYERSSVLAGQSRRVYLEEWETIEDAREALTAAGVDYADDYDDGTTSHVPVEQVIAHIPENDYDREGGSF
tara:strand:+ start:367 stop:690 length:324 start_codon:yes stop_codon:yes gene_type:complete